MEYSCSAIRKLHAAYKPATDRVLRWIRVASSVPMSEWRTTSVSSHFKLADKLVRKGTPMPEDILSELNTAINSRYQVAEILASQGTGDLGHTHMIYTLMRILHLFRPPSPPATPQMVGQEQLYAAPSIAYAQPDWGWCPSPAEGLYQPCGQQQQQQPPPQPVFFSPGVHLTYGNPIFEQQPPPPPPQAMFPPGAHHIYGHPMPGYFEFVPGNQQCLVN